MLGGREMSTVDMRLEVIVMPVSDADRADELGARGVEVSEVFHGSLSAAYMIAEQTGEELPT